MKLYRHIKNILGVSLFVVCSSITVTSCTTKSNSLVSKAPLTINQQVGGTVSLKDIIPNSDGIYYVPLNETIEFIVNVDDGYTLDSLTINSADITDTLTYTPTISTNFAVDVEYSLCSGTISYDEDVIGGTIKFENYEGNNINIGIGSEVLVSAVPDEGYTLTSLTVNGTDISSSKSFVVEEATTYYVTGEFTLGEEEVIHDYSYLYDNDTVFPDRGSQSVDIDEYYEPVRGLKGEELKDGLHEIIKEHTSSSYSQARSRLQVTDVDPYNENNLIRIYEGSLDADEVMATYSREHVWAKSHGDIDEVAIMNGDLHNLHLSQTSLNSTRGNLNFGTVDHNSSTSISSLYGDRSRYHDLMDGNYISSSLFEPKDEYKGDVARTIFYMAVRYEGDQNGEVDLEVEGTRDETIYYTFDVNNADGKHGNFMDLYEWATTDIDPVSDYEVNRNNLIDQKYQHNRNPFIDHPEFVIMIYDKTYNGPGALEDGMLEN